MSENRGAESTLAALAEVLTPVLEHQVVTDLWFKKLRGYRPRIGDRIRSVDAVGKYLLIEFDRRRRCGRCP